MKSNKNGFLIITKPKDIKESNSVILPGIIMIIGLLSIVISFFRVLGITGAGLSYEPDKISGLYLKLFSITAVIFMFYIFMNRMIKMMRYLSFFLLGISASLLLIFWNLIKAGIISVYNKYIQYFNLYYDMNVAAAANRNDLAQRGTTIFLYALLYLIIGILFYFILYRKKNISYVFLTLPFMVLELAVGLMPSFWELFCYILSLFFFTAMSIIKSKKTYVDDKLSVKISTVLIGCIAFLFIAVSHNFTQEDYKEKINNKQLKADFQERFKAIEYAFFSDILSMDRIKGSGGVGEGKLGRISEVNIKNEPQFEVSMLKLDKQRVYFRSYIGSTYTGTSFDNLAKNDLEAYEKLFEELKKEKFDSVNQTSQLYKILKQDSVFLKSIYYPDGPVAEAPFLFSVNLPPFTFYESQLKVKNIASRSKYALVPYNSEIYTDKSPLELESTPFRDYWENKDEHYYTYVSENSADGEIKGIFNDFGINQMYQIVSTLKEEKLLFEKLLGKSLKNYTLADRNKNSNKTMEDLYQDYLLTNKDEEVNFYPNGTGVLVNTVVERLNNIERYLEAEEKYRNFVHEQYTKLPKGKFDEISKEWKKKYQYKSEFDKLTNNLFIPDYNRQLDIETTPISVYVKDYFIPDEDKIETIEQYSILEIAEYVKEYLKKHASYTLSPGSLPEGEDFVTYFLTEGKKGYCTHFAAAATVMFREMGVPARYVEGYVAMQDNMNTVVNKDELTYRYNDEGRNVTIQDRVSLDLLDSNAHAWTEIYVDGYGWYPVEVTPGFSGTSLPIDLKYPKTSGFTGNEGNLIQDLNGQTPNNKEEKKEPAVNKEKQNEETDNKKNDVKNDTQKREKQNMNYIIIAVVLFIFFILQAAIRIGAEKFIWKKSTREGKAGILFKKIQKLLVFYKIRPLENNDYLEYAKLVEDKLKFPPDAFYHILMLAAKAKFSNIPLGQEEIEEIMECYHKIKQQLYKNSSKKKQFYLRYIKII